MKVQVVGGGGWGLALARLLALNGNNVRLWCRTEDNPERLRETRESATFLPGVRLPDSIDVHPETDFNADIAVLAAPSHAMRIVADQHRFSDATIRINVAKGIENDSLLRMSQVIADAAPGGPVVTLSGPSHAEEVGRGLPASVVVAGADMDVCTRVQSAFFCKSFRVYTSTDLVGVELGGSLKNVAAIAAGICDGLGLGDNAKAALITRSLAEITRAGVACGADARTFMGLSGMGDLIVTCASRHSRNRHVGEAIAQGQTLDEILGATAMVAEGVRTTKSACALATKLGIEMPIARAVYAMLFENQRPQDALEALMTREARPELD